MTEFLARLKQRKLVQWALAYAAFAFALMQGLDIVAQQFGWPEGARRGITLALVVGLFVVLVLAWYHGERGVQRIGTMEIMILALLLAIGGTLIWRFGPAVATRSGRSMMAGADSAVAFPPDSTTPTRVADFALPMPAASVPEKSVAVLPFADESGSKDEQFFSDGLSEDLITALSQFAGLKVINRDSSFRFRDSSDGVQAIAAKLGVAHLLEGSVQQQGGEVRITATLVNAADGSVVWSQRYDKPYKDLFKLQDVITQSVADALKAKLLTPPGAVAQSDRPPSGNLAAYDAFLRGEFYAKRITKEGERKAIGYYTDAVALDPHYARAWAELANARTALAGNFLSGPQRARELDKARTAIQTALSLDPELAVAHVARAYLLWGTELDWTGAEAEARRAVQLAPHDEKANRQLAQILAALGRPRQAINLLQKVLATDPLCARCLVNMAAYLLSLGRFEEALQAIDEASRLQPGDSEILKNVVFVDVVRGDDAAALQTARAIPPGTWRDLGMAYALQVGPDRGAADAALRRVMDTQAGFAAYQIAEIFALRKNPDALFAWLDRAWKNRDGGIIFLLTDPLILRYRDDPRFAAFCRKVGLPSTTDAVAMP
ncbi:MAG TPA: tetratricopeptide repeat protein [Rhodanobacteraceae bacterium]|nr:tetratricopeptide repeat protein [Rhodanobacteraceae bacterium]